MEISIKKIKEYFKNSIKFYELKCEWLTPLVFVIILAASFIVKLFLIDLGNIYSVALEDYLDLLSNNGLNISNIQNSDINRMFELLQTSDFMDSMIPAAQNLFNTTSKMIGLFLLKTITVFLITRLYLNFYIYETRYGTMNAAYCIKSYFARLPKLVIVNIIVTLGLFIASLIALFLGLIIPFLIILIAPLLIAGFVYIYIGFIFKDALILDKNTGIIESLKMSLKYTKFSKKRILINIVIMYLIYYIIEYFIPYQPASAMLVSSFFEVIYIIVINRLIVLMYRDSIKKDEKPLMKS